MTTSTKYMCMSTYDGVCESCWILHCPVLHNLRTKDTVRACMPQTLRLKGPCHPCTCGRAPSDATECLE
eukprot:m.744791 g.744791  ORF g.744791 m.744791 type:complete len:69 (+) comp23124_c0_seq36:694-900(+)